jgi:hypothetical protein
MQKKCRKASKKIALRKRNVVGVGVAIFLGFTEKSEKNSRTKKAVTSCYSVTVVIFNYLGCNNL